MSRLSSTLHVSVVLCGIFCVSNSFNHQGFNRNYLKYNTIRNPKILKELIKYEPNYDQSKTNPAAINISVIVSIDEALLDQYVRKYGRRAKAELKRFTYKALLGAEARFGAPSLVNRVHLDVLDVNFLKNNSRVLPMSAYGSDYLMAYCHWQSKKKTNESTWFSILLTGLDLYYIDSKGKKAYMSDARSYRNGVCNIQRSCAVVEGKSWNLAHVLTHEIGHSIGIRHDGDKNKCNHSDYIMAAVVDRHRVPNAWSTCSADYLRGFLMSKKSRCLKG